LHVLCADDTLPKDPDITIDHDQAEVHPHAPRPAHDSAKSHGQGVATQTWEAMMAKPAYRAYSVIKREGKEDFWLNLGICYAHDDDMGFNLLLQALPVDAKLVLRVYKEKPEEQEAEIQKGKKYRK
jgi:hypothetical protein